MQLHILEQEWNVRDHELKTSQALDRVSKNTS